MPQGMLLLGRDGRKMVGLIFETGDLIFELGDAPRLLDAGPFQLFGVLAACVQLALGVLQGQSMFVGSLFQGCGVFANRVQRLGGRVHLLLSLHQGHSLSGRALRFQQGGQGWAVQTAKGFGGLNGRGQGVGAVTVQGE